MGVKIDNNGDSVHCMHFWQLFDHVVFSVIVNITVTKKVKSTVGYHSCCSGQVAASTKCKRCHYAMLVSFCLFVCLFATAGAYRVDPCLLLYLVWFIVAVVRQVHLRHNNDISFWCHCSPALSATLRSLSTVYSQQQECTPDRQKCTVDSKASEAWQTFPVNNASQLRLSLDWTID